MNYKRNLTKTAFKAIGQLLFMLMICGIESSIFAQTDGFGTLDRFYGDSVTAQPGRDVAVTFAIANDEPLSSVSLPITYNPEILTLRSINFSGTRIEHISNKLIQPAQVDSIHGHFLIGVFILFEDPIPAGDGPVFSAVFSLSETAEDGIIELLDSLFFPPGGELILVESSTSEIIRPAFTPGKIVVREKINYPPVVTTIPDQYVFEGDSLEFTIGASDQNKDLLVISCLEKPSGAVFVDNGDNTASFAWRPSFIGPFSSDGSPFSLSLRVSDGTESVTSDIRIRVLNKNRKPLITDLAPLEAESGSMIEFDVNVYEPDFEPVQWTVAGLPEGATFDFANPGQVSWQSHLADTGLYTAQFIATDPHGYADSSEVVIRLTAAPVYTLYLDTIAGDPGEIVTYDISLDNRLPVSGFDLLIHYDPSAFILQSVKNESTRSAGFDQFSYAINPGGFVGDISVMGITDTTGPLDQLLGAGDGPVAQVTFRIVGDVGLGGMVLPVRFTFRDTPINHDNTLTDTLGARILQSAMTYFDGEIWIYDLGDVEIGDINLNGIAYDIADAIYFTNHFMDPINYPFNPLQYANSDVNGDHIAATIADLVALINALLKDGYAKPTSLTDIEVQVDSRNSETGFEIAYASEYELGAAFIKLRSPIPDIGAYLRIKDDNMMVSVRQENSEVRVLIYSLEGNRLSAGAHTLLSIDGAAEITLESIEIASADGLPAAIVAAKSVTLPEQFDLHQNYPNPFNPSTTIEFDLPQEGMVTLNVYNIMGAKVSTLIDKRMEAGNHAIVWDGTDDAGAHVASGVYLYRIDTIAGSMSRKMMLLK